jgi:RsbT co-antagonist protein rsbRD N-terminal domain
MKLEKHLTQKKAPIVGRWLDLIFETYPADAQRFLRKQKDRFANPVGTTITKEIENLYDELIKGLAPNKVTALLDRIIRIRAVQDFSPSQALTFVFHLKKAIKEELQTEIVEDRLSEDLATMESRIDDLALLAFDVYMNCREKLYEIQANAVKNQVSRLLKRAGMIVDFPDTKSKLENGNQT